MKNKIEKITTEILYESKGKTLNGEPFIRIKRARGYYEYSERGGVNSIFFILYDKNIDKYALIYEAKPPCDEIEGRQVQMWSAFGGSIDKEIPYIEICKEEVLEECGYRVSIGDIEYIGKTLVSTQMNQMAYGFLVDVTNLEKTEIAEYEVESNDEFSKNSVQWFTEDEVLEIGEWKSIYIISKYKKCKNKRLLNK